MLYIVFCYGISTLGVSVGVFYYIRQQDFLQKNKLFIRLFYSDDFAFLLFFFIDKTSLRFRQHNNKSIFNKLKFHWHRLIQLFIRLFCSDDFAFLLFVCIVKTSLRFRQHNNKSIFNNLKFHLHRLIAYFLYLMFYIL